MVAFILITGEAVGVAVMVTVLLVTVTECFRCVLLSTLYQLAHLILVITQGSK